jgi:hypothetical protein
MDPSTVLTPQHWLLINAMLSTLWLLALLMVNGAFAFLLGTAIIPSVVATRPALSNLERFKRPLYAIGIVAFALAILQLVRFVNGLIVLNDQLYPRPLI